MSLFQVTAEEIRRIQIGNDGQIVRVYRQELLTSLDGLIVFLCSYEVSKDFLAELMGAAHAGQSFPTD